MPDLVRRSGEVATIRSRFLRVWGVPESKVAQIAGPRLEALEGGPTTIAFLASATEGVRVRVTTRATGSTAEADADRALDVEEAELRALFGEAVGGVDGEGLELVVGRLLVRAGLRLAVAESLTGGMVGARLTSVPGASDWFAGGVVAYASDVKRRLLSVRHGAGGERTGRPGNGSRGGRAVGRGPRPFAYRRRARRPRTTSLPVRFLSVWPACPTTP